MTVRPLLAALALTAGLATAAEAQDACRRYRAELAGLGRGASEGPANVREVAQLTAYYKSIGCEGGTFLFFDTRPAQCGALAQRIRSLATANTGEIDVSARRRHLRAAIAEACDRPREASERPAGERVAQGGSQVICVRSCDGGYFPMNNLPDGRAGADQLCQAMCPGTAAVAYSMPQGDEGLAQAAAVRDRRAYTSMPNAYKFRTAFNPSCSCRREGESWTQQLAKAERMLDRHQGDLIVTAATAEALSRPKITPLSRAALARLKTVPLGDVTMKTKAQPVTAAAATMAATRNADVSAAPAKTVETARNAEAARSAEIAKTADLDARTATTGSVATTPPPPAEQRAIRVIATPAARH